MLKVKVSSQKNEKLYKRKEKTWKVLSVNLSNRNKSQLASSFLFESYLRHGIYQILRCDAKLFADTTRLHIFLAGDLYSVTCNVEVNASRSACEIFKEGAPTPRKLETKVNNRKTINYELASP